VEDMSLIRWSLVFGLGGRQSTFLVLKNYFSFGLGFFWEEINIQYEYYLSMYSLHTFSEPSTPLSFLPTAAYLIPEMGINDFYYAYSEGVSPQTAIDEILPKSLNLVVSAVEVKKTCQQPLYLTQME
jgi:hypothetical protein